MITRLLHPSDSALARFAESPESNDASTRLREHLASCQTCRDHIAFLRALPERLAGLGAPEADDTLLERIQGRLARKDRVILPVDAPARSPRRASWLVAAAVLLVVATLWVASSARDLRADATSGELRFAPEQLVSGPIEVTYRDVGLFSGAKRLTLRARFRTKNDESYNSASKQWSVATLARGNGGDFHTTLRVPDSVVYAAFAIESEDGGRVDDNGHKLWYLMTHERDGRPTYDAVWQRANDLMGENIELSMHELQGLARLYGERAEAWGAVAAIERFMLGDAHADSTTAAHCERLVHFESLLRARATLDMAQVSAIRSYAVQLDDRACPQAQEIASSLRAVLAHDTTGAPASLSMRYAERLKAIGTQPAHALALAEEFWPPRVETAPVIYNNGLNFAVAAKDSAAMLRWADRNAAHAPGVASGSYSMLLRQPLVRQAALGRLRETLRRFRTRQDSLRPLEHSVIEQVRLDSATARRILMLIGNALLDDGKVAAGLDTLNLATRGGWEPELYRRVAAATFRIGDTARALPLLARVSVDPATTQAAADSLARVATRFMTPAAWTNAQRDARETMRTTVLEDARLVPIGKSPHLQDSAGHTTNLAELSKKRTTVVVFFSRFCAPSRQELAMLPALAARLEQEGIRLVTITREAPSSELRSFVQQARVALPLYHDTWGEAGRAFQDFGTPEYFIVDPRGRIRFRYTALSKVLTQAVVLKEVEQDER
ncbi:MAG: TlpA disulfide reductase family protein [bacterium]